MEAHSEVWIFEQVSGKDQNDGLFRLHKALLQQFLQSGKRDRGGRLTANTFGSNFSFGLRDLEFAHLFASTASGLKNLDSFFPRSPVSAADRRRPRFSLGAGPTLASTLAQRSQPCV